jgi:DNA-binding HxlR family transcriptional regulator
VHNTFLPTVEYSITKHGKSLQKLLDELHRWGLKHRKEVIGERKKQKSTLKRLF